MHVSRLFIVFTLLFRVRACLFYATRNTWSVIALFPWQQRPRESKSEWITMLAWPSKGRCRTKAEGAITLYLLLPYSLFWSQQRLCSLNFTSVQPGTPSSGFHKQPYTNEVPVSSAHCLVCENSCCLNWFAFSTTTLMIQCFQLDLPSSHRLNTPLSYITISDLPYSVWQTTINLLTFTKHI